MSFGFSIGDFFEIAKLVEATRKRLKGAPAEYTALAVETRTLQIVVTDLKVQVEDDELDDSIKHELRSALQNCEAILKDLNIVIDSHTELSPSTSASKKLPQRIWKRLKWDPEEISKLRLRLVSSIQLLGAVRQSVDSAVLSDLVQAVEKLNVERDNAEDACIADWLAPGVQAELQVDYFAKVQPGTAQWIFSDPTYCNWESNAQPTLLLSGIPGAGKTFLASVIITSLQKQLNHEEDSALAFFYNSYNRTATQSRLDLISSIMRQLFLQKSQNGDIIKNMYKEHNKPKSENEENNKPTTASRPTLEEMVLSFEKLLLGFKKVTFVFDALDECRGFGGPDELRHWKYVLDLLFKLQKRPNCSTTILILATSRPDKEIEDLFKEAERLTIEASDSDLEIFCDAQIPLIKCMANKPSRHPEIKEAICKSSRGMFLLAKLHCDTLAAKTKPREVTQALKTFQHGGDALDRAYEETMRRIQSHQHGELATKVLGFVTYAAAPLTLTELRHALAVTEDTHELDPEEDLDDPDIIISSCAGLVTVDSGSEVVRLVHYTTQRFLESLGSQLLSDPDSFFATCCLNYMHLDIFKLGHIDIIRDRYTHHRSLIQEFPFFTYCARYWPHHMSLTTPSVHLRRRTFSFLDSSGRAGSALAVVDGKTRSHGRTGLHLLAYLGLNDWISEYIDSGHPLDLDAYCDVLCPSCRKLATENSRRLKSHGTLSAKVLTSAIDGFGQTLLWSAVEGGQPSTVRLLIDLTPELLDVQNVNGDTALMIATRLKGELAKASALLMLENPQLVSWIRYRDGGFQQSYLHAAVRHGSTKVFDRLLEIMSAQEANEADAMEGSLLVAQDKEGRTPLLLAVRSSFELYKKFNLYFVKRLLANSGGCDLNIPDDTGATPLHIAAAHGSLRLVRYLMSQQSIEADIRDNQGRSALHKAAANLREPVLEYLLGTGSFDADSVDRYGLTPLFYAASEGKLKSATILANREDVDLDRVDKYGMSVQMHAANRNRLEIVAFLAPLVRNINLADLEGNTILHHLLTGLAPRGFLSGPNDPPWKTRFRSCLVSLVKSDASLNIRNCKNETPYEVLCRYLRTKVGNVELSERCKILEELKLIMEEHMQATT